VRFHTNHLISNQQVSSFQASQRQLTPGQVAKAYGLPSPNNLGTGAIAIVDAFNYPTALKDFNMFSSTYSLPTESSTRVTALSNRTLQVVYASGSTPESDAGWSQEMAIDIEWAHAMAPNAKIYLVEAASNNWSDLLAAVKVAKVLPGVREVSTSFGSSEFSCVFASFDNVFSQNGVAFFAASGDQGGGRMFPALSKNVVAVGGTTLNVDIAGNWLSESVWADTGCGPSAFELRPMFQDLFQEAVGKYRAGCDLAAIADPNTGVLVYDSYGTVGVSGWIVMGGTSVACPIVAGIANGSGVRFPNSQSFNQLIYTHPGSQFIHPVTSGSAGGFVAGGPWSFPAGLGTPNGLANLIGGTP